MMRHATETAQHIRDWIQLQQPPMRATLAPISSVDAVKS
jgi:hypothetical protein